MSDIGISVEGAANGAAMRAVAVAVAVAVGVRRHRPARRPRSHAQSAQGLPIIRDTEIENLLRDYATPILRAAGLAQQNIKVVVLNDRTFNAFVMDGRHIFINAGALFDAKTPNEVIGVLAHETGHLAGGHLQRLREQLAHAQTASIVAMLAGIGAAVAGARAGSGGGDVRGAGDPGAADRDPALAARVRAHAGRPGRPCGRRSSSTQRISRREAWSICSSASPTRACTSRASSIPICRRIRCRPIASPLWQQIAKASPYWDKKDSPELQLRHDMMRAKLSGFLETPGTVARRFPASDHSLPARYARAISSLSPRRPAQRPRPDRRSDPGRAEQSLFLRAQGPGAARSRQAGRGGPAACAARWRCRTARR